MRPTSRALQESERQRGPVRTIVLEQIALICKGGNLGILAVVGWRTKSNKFSESNVSGGTLSRPVICT